MKHPIPFETLENIDVHVIKKDGTQELFIITSGRLTSDEEVVSRLIDKITNYLNIIHYDDFIKEYGHPTKDKVFIIIKCSETPESPIVDMVEKLKAHAEKNDASLSIDFG